MDKVDIVIIGAGVIGLSIASEVGETGRSVFLLEKNNSWGQETSSRNSEVIHAGIYYPQGSLKAKACVYGRNMLYALCEKERIPFKKTGKLIIAACEAEREALNEVYNKAKSNGVDLRFLSKSDAHKKEPDVFCVGALFSPDTGIVDSHSLMKYFLNKAKSNGVNLVCDSEVVGIEKQGMEYKITVNNQGETISFLSRVVINCAGNNADKVAAMCGIDIKAQGYQQYYLKGNYFRLANRNKFVTRHLVYPVPQKRSLGVHTVLDLQGEIRLGPDEEEVEKIDYCVDENKKRFFFESARKYLPFITEDDLSPDMAGIRPQLRRPNRGNFKDFFISHEDTKGFSGLINLVGLESPGLTASPYIGKYVAEMVRKIS